MNEEVLKKVVSFGIDEKYLRDSLKNNKHNHTTTSYFLALKGTGSSPELLRDKITQVKLNKLIKKA